MKLQGFDPKKQYIIFDDRPPSVLTVKEEEKTEFTWPPGGLYIAIVLFILFTWGEPDLLGALIYFLMN